jgi:hypothetical protein
VFLSGDGIIQVALMRVEGAVKAAYGTPNPKSAPPVGGAHRVDQASTRNFSPEISS